MVLEQFSPVVHDLLQRSRAVITVILSVSSWPSFRRPLWLEPVRSETLTNRRSVRMVCPIRAPTQDRIKFIVWVWNSALPFRGLLAEDPRAS
ncbi:hypothetical protein PanWU01x14_230900 [Parasponia andersonii]|uniref:Uncharacterized protein n=1 Tax=Parasponia andersonii TaxID=3476 RepID=A0A2P5BKK8_PARAD|nr:hypothetical protein PanWU01x14_230900 [Parasponia andersonii]